MLISKKLEEKPNDSTEIKKTSTLYQGRVWSSKPAIALYFLIFALGAALLIHGCATSHASAQLNATLNSQATLNLQATVGVVAGTVMALAGGILIIAGYHAHQKKQRDTKNTDQAQENLHKNKDFEKNAELILKAYHLDKTTINAAKQLKTNEYLEIKINSEAETLVVVRDRHNGLTVSFKDRLASLKAVQSKQKSYEKREQVAALKAVQSKQKRYEENVELAFKLHFGKKAERPFYKKLMAQVKKLPPNKSVEFKQKGQLPVYFLRSSRGGLSIVFEETLDLLNKKN